MKKIRLILLICLAAALLCSCGVKEAAQSAVDYVKSEIDLVCGEWDDIVEFYDYEPRRAIKLSLRWRIIQTRIASRSRLL